MHSMHGQAAGSALLEREVVVTGVDTDSSSACPMNPAELLAELREMNRTYRDNQNAWLRLNNQELAIVRRELDCSKGEAVKILKEILKGAPKPETVSVVSSLTIVSRCRPFEAAKVPLLVEQKRARSYLEKEILRLPVSIIEWVRGTRGLGLFIFSQIIAETGDLSGYSTPSKLWKRLGLAVIDGERQRKHRDKLKALESGYSPRRRALMWNVGECLIKLNRDGAYKAAYDARKTHEQQVNEAGGHERTPIHIHRRAKRFMEKLLLKDLWVVWRAAWPERSSVAGSTTQQDQ